MLQKIDPFAACCITLLISCLIFFICIFILEREKMNNKASITKEAIQQGWTPEQVNNILSQIKK